MTSLTTKSMLVAGALMLCAGPAAAQPAAGQRPPAGTGEAQPGADPAIIVKPPGNGDPRLVKPAPPHRDQGLIEKPPADAVPGERDRTKPRAGPPPRSRADRPCNESTEHRRR